MINLFNEHAITIISTLFGGGSFFAFFIERKKNNALTSQEVSKSDQDKISTAEKTIDLIDKLRSRMERQFEEMDKEIQNLKKELNEYIKQCGPCANNKIARK
jgi:septal ring factor EnvC (AmiA/AmiB activator)